MHGVAELDASADSVRGHRSGLRVLRVPPLSYGHAHHRLPGVFPLPSSSRSGRAADGLSGVLRHAVRPLRSFRRGRHCTARCDRLERAGQALERHVALSRGAARRGAGHARRRLDADAQEPAPCQRLAQGRRGQSDRDLQGARAGAGRHHGAPLRAAASWPRPRRAMRAARWRPMPQRRESRRTSSCPGTRPWPTRWSAARTART